jgi:hypothetical protein
MFKVKLFCLTAALLLICGATAADSNPANKFIFPSQEGLTFNRYDKVNVSYETDYTNITFWLFCNIPTKPGPVCE